MDLERSMDRARVYRLFARVFQTPEPSRFEALRREDVPGLRGTLERLGADRDLLAPVERLLASVEGAALGELRRDYEIVFEPAGGLRCPPNETAHAPDSPQEGLTRSFQLADIAGFYRAFGVEVTPGSERPDHIAAELEFMHLLAVKEALAEERGESANAEICRDAAAAFLREHLARWCGRLRSRLEQTSPAELYRLAGEALDRFVELDLASFPAERPPGL
jgi:DMSO reductase family type II enzyme chaperone